MRSKAQQDAGSTLPGFALFLSLFMVPVLTAVQSESISRVVEFTSPQLSLPFSYLETVRTVHGLKLAPLSGSFQRLSDSELEDAEVYLDQKQDNEVQPGKYCSYIFRYVRSGSACSGELIHEGNSAYGASGLCQQSAISASMVQKCKSVIADMKGLLPNTSCTQDLVCQINIEQAADVDSYTVVPLGHFSADQTLQL